MRTLLATQVVQLASWTVRRPSDVAAVREVAPVIQRETGIKSTCRLDTTAVPGAPSMALASLARGLRRSWRWLGWEIHQVALTSTRTLPEISEFAASANASLTPSSGST
jgi:hypothetical protein